MCRKCEEREITKRQIFIWQPEGNDDLEIYSVDKAYAMAAKSNAPIIQLNPEEIQEVLQYNDCEEEHFDHVRPYTDSPGIIGTCQDGSHILLDGAHRAGYCKKIDKEFPVYLLDEKSTRRCRIGVGLTAPKSRPRMQTLGTDELGVPVEIDETKSTKK